MFPVFLLLGNRLLELTRIPQGVTVIHVQCSYDSSERLDFRNETFDAVLCAHPPFGSWSRIPSKLQEWRRVAKIGGLVGFAGYSQNAFQPPEAMFESRMQCYGVGNVSLVQSFSWRLSDAEACSDLLRDAGFEKIEVRIEQLGYYMEDAGEWWDIVLSCSIKSALSQLSSEQAQQFKAEHLQEISALATAKGIWLNVPVIFAVGRKPA